MDVDTSGHSDQMTANLIHNKVDYADIHIGIRPEGKFKDSITFTLKKKWHLYIIHDKIFICNLHIHMPSFDKKKFGKQSRSYSDEKSTCMRFIVQHSCIYSMIQNVLGAFLKNKQ